MPKINIPQIPKIDFKKIATGDKKKFALFVAIIAAMIVVTVLLMPYFTKLLDGDTREAFVQSIRSKGPWGVLILLALQVLQVIVAFIPGEVVQLVAGVLYGSVGGWAICTAGTAISTVIVFKLVEKLGRPFVEDMVSSNMMRKLDNLNRSKRLDVIMFVLFFIPGLPKDVFTYFAPLTRIPLGRFLVISLIARTPALVASTFGGSAFTQGEYGRMIVVFLIFGTIGALGILFRDHILDFFSDKRAKTVKRLAAGAEERRQRRRNDAVCDPNRRQRSSVSTVQDMNRRPLPSVRRSAIQPTSGQRKSEGDGGA